MAYSGRNLISYERFLSGTGNNKYSYFSLYSLTLIFASMTAFTKSRWNKNKMSLMKKSQRKSFNNCKKQVNDCLFIVSYILNVKFIYKSFRSLVFPCKILKKFLYLSIYLFLSCPFIHFHLLFSSFISFRQYFSIFLRY